MMDNKWMPTKDIYSVIKLRELIVNRNSIQQGEFEKIFFKAEYRDHSIS